MCINEKVDLMQGGADKVKRFVAERSGSLSLAGHDYCTIDDKEKSRHSRVPLLCMSVSLWRPGAHLKVKEKEKSQGHKNEVNTALDGVIVRHRIQVL